MKSRLALFAALSCLALSSAQAHEPPTAQAIDVEVMDHNSQHLASPRVLLEVGQAAPVRVSRHVQYPIACTTKDGQPQACARDAFKENMSLDIYRPSKDFLKFIIKGEELPEAPRPISR